MLRFVFQQAVPHKCPPENFATESHSQQITHQLLALQFDSTNQQSENHWNQQKKSSSQKLKTSKTKTLWCWVHADLKTESNAPWVLTLMNFLIQGSFLSLLSVVAGSIFGFSITLTKSARSLTSRSNGLLLAGSSSNLDFTRRRRSYTSFPYDLCFRTCLYLSPWHPFSFVTATRTSLRTTFATKWCSCCVYLRNLHSAGARY